MNTADLSNYAIYRLSVGEPTVSISPLPSEREVRDGGLLLLLTHPGLVHVNLPRPIGRRSIIVKQAHVFTRVVFEGAFRRPGDGFPPPTGTFLSFGAFADDALDADFWHVGLL